ncbi:MAG TPA: HAD family hydrolase [Chloroflexia bacterium]|nr:HAD family hydrolase [Chloroflexia bacterium]
MSTITAVTLDFHDTLVRSDSWLHLEIVTLPGAVLEWLVASGYLPSRAADPATLSAAETAYRGIREEAKASGREVPAAPGVWRVLTTLGLDTGLADGTIDAAVEAVERRCLEDTALVPGVLEALAALKAAGLCLAVVSSAAYTPFVHWALARHGLVDYFPVVATSAATGYYKSDPRLYAWALAKLGVDAAHAVHVGDHPRFDVQGAQAAGMRALLYAPDPGTPAPDDCQPDAILTAMHHLPTLIAGLA